jgi:XTP/dITP diphosphohydrolase
MGRTLKIHKAVPLFGTAFFVLKIYVCKMKLIFATNNAHKLAEIKSAISNFEIVGLKEYGITEDIPETGKTLKANARIKARYIYDKFGESCFADDTGLEVAALNGEPGVYSARYAGEQCSYQDNNTKLLSELNTQINRKAQFRTVICLILNGEEIYFEGICTGEILKDYQGEEGFGYDPLFQPTGYSRSFAQMTTQEKNKISHRGLAVQKLLAFLGKYETR